MNKLRILLIFVTLFLIKTSFTSAQISVNINIDSQPLWGPVAYDYVEYYYLPEYGIYYYAPKAQFVYRKGNKWLFSNKLPYQYRQANLYTTYKVVINEPKPYLRNDYYANNYKQYKQEHSKQDIIRDSHDSKYTKRKDHPNYSHKNVRIPQHKNTYSTGNKNSSKDKSNKQRRR